MAESSGKGKIYAVILLLLVIVVALAVTVGILASRPTTTIVTTDDCDKEAKTSPAAPPTAPPSVKRSEGEFRYAAVAADAKPCPRVGTDILAKKGGSVVDAAIATLLCSGVYDMQSMGLGGGFLMTIHDKNKGGTRALIAREKAPGAATQTMYVNETASSIFGGMAVGVPGEILGYWTAWQEYGKLPWKDLFQPAIKLAREGFEVGPFLYDAMRYHLVTTAMERPDNNLGDIVKNADGSLKEIGDMIKLPKLAATLEKIAEEGAHTYYNGSLAQDVVDDIKDMGGIITLEDLKNYNVVFKDPVKVHLKNGNYTVHNPPPPSGGLIVDYILNILDGYNWTPDDINTDETKIQTYHRIAEAMKFAYGKRTIMGDDDFADLSVLKTNLTSDDFAEATRLKINDTHTQPTDFYEPVYEQPTDGGTVHLAVLAPDGNAVSVTSTINLYFGCMYVGKRTGIIFNNEMDDFSTPGLVNAFGYQPSPANYIKPGKRPLSSMSPTIVTDGNGDVALLIGGSGGSRIISSIAFASVHNLWLGTQIKDAVDNPRVHHQLVPQHIRHEPTLPKKILEGLKSKGHAMSSNEVAGNVQAISVNCPKTCPMLDEACRKPCIQAAVDERQRREGIPDGF